MTFVERLPISSLLLPVRDGPGELVGDLVMMQHVMTLLFGRRSPPTRHCLPVVDDTPVQLRFDRTTSTSTGITHSLFVPYLSDCTPLSLDICYSFGAIENAGVEDAGVKKRKSR